MLETGPEAVFGHLILGVYRGKGFSQYCKLGNVTL